jgi:two-component system phosphate regulon response regulator PhoB
MNALTENMAIPGSAVARLPVLKNYDAAIIGFDPISIGRLSLCTSNHYFTINGMVVTLTNAEFRLLRFMMINNGNVVSREAILRKAWKGNVVVGERTVDVHVLKLRKILAQYGLANSIQTIRGIGYRSVFSHAEPAMLLIGITI